MDGHEEAGSDGDDRLSVFVFETSPACTYRCFLILHSVFKPCRPVFIGTMPVHQLLDGIVGHNELNGILGVKRCVSCFSFLRFSI